MRSLRLTIAYDGTLFAGWQVQPELRTVQGELEAAWKQITGEAIRVTASGRTDAGVHAHGQVVGVATDTVLDEAKLLRGLNAVLPNDVIIREIVAAAPGFHATHDALRKTYRYHIHHSRVRPLFDRNFVWHVPAKVLDEAAMGRAGGLLVGRHDFASFETAGSERASSVRTISELSVTRDGERVTIAVTGDGFLYNMVRSIAGTLAEVGRGVKSVEWVAEVLAARDRATAGPTAPPQGLVLWQVEYAE
jgi:tRNA pseudouridine38-40 synthase